MQKTMAKDKAYGHCDSEVPRILEATDILFFSGRNRRPAD